MIRQTVQEEYTKITKDLIRQLKTGDEHAFKVLVESYKDHIINTCFHYVHDHSDAEDLAQDVFIEVHRSIRHFKELCGEHQMKKLSMLIQAFFQRNPSLQSIPPGHRRQGIPMRPDQEIP